MTQQLQPRARGAGTGSARDEEFNRAAHPFQADVWPVVFAYAPTFLTAVTAATYLAAHHFHAAWSSESPIIAPAVGVVGIILVGLFWRAMAALLPKRRATPELDEIDQRTAIVEARCSAVMAELRRKSCQTLAEAAAPSIAEIANCLAMIKRVRRTSQLPDNAYAVSLWKLLHCAEEAFIMIDRREDVVEGALYDELRLQGSTIDNAEQMLGRLRVAATRLSAEAAQYLNRLPSAPLRPEVNGRFASHAHVVAVSANGAAKKTNVARVRRLARVLGGSKEGRDSAPTWTECMSEEELQAREVLRQVRRGINKFRDGRRYGLVHARNHLRWITGTIGALTYLLLTFALLTGVTDQVLYAVTALYLIGAVVGLFRRLNDELVNDTAVNDYGLFSARLLVTPLFSGLAAIGGVLVTSLVYFGATGYPPLHELPGPASAASTTVASATTDAQGTATGVRLIPKAEQIFNLDNTPFELVVAGVFGLTPNLLLSGLQAQSARFKADLQSSEAPEKGKA